MALAQTLAGSARTPRWLEVLWDLDDILGVVDEEFGEVAVAEVDAALVVDFLAGDVVAADDVEERAAGASDGAGDEVAGLDLGDMFADFEDPAEASRGR